MRRRRITTMKIGSCRRSVVMNTKNLCLFSEQGVTQGMTNRSTPKAMGERFFSRSVVYIPVPVQSRYANLPGRSAS
jgi:hypothetical protein